MYSNKNRIIGSLKFTDSALENSLFSFIYFLVLFLYLEGRHTGVIVKEVKGLICHCTEIFSQYNGV